jgi:cyclophilin family peptidyl-prolyl cis-trans isomerase
MKLPIGFIWGTNKTRNIITILGIIIIILVVLFAIFARDEGGGVDPNKDIDYGEEFKEPIEWEVSQQITGSIRGVSPGPVQVSNQHQFEVRGSARELQVSVSWSGGLDLDVYLYDADGNDVGGVNGATTNNPEVIIITNVRNPGMWTMEVVAFASLVGSSYTADITQNHRARNAVLITEKGNISFKLYEMRAPNTTTNFINLAESEFYTNLTFHRVVADFVIQTGDPTGTGEGGSDKTIDLEVHPELIHLKGAVGMARAEDPNSASSQFYVTMDEYPHLDGNYSVFGQVFSGMNVVWQIRKGDILESVEILDDEELE